MARVGRLILGASAIVMFLIEEYWFMQWWEAAGVFAAVMIPPLLLVFPFIFLVKEGFSVIYFGVWAAGLLGLFTAAAFDE